MNWAERGLVTIIVGKLPFIILISQIILLQPGMVQKQNINILMKILKIQVWK